MRRSPLPQVLCVALTASTLASFQDKKAAMPAARLRRPPHEPPERWHPLGASRGRPSMPGAKLACGRLSVLVGVRRSFIGRNSQTGHTLIETCDLIDFAQPALNLSADCRLVFRIGNTVLEYVQCQLNQIVANDVVLTFGLPQARDYAVNRTKLSECP